MKTVFGNHSLECQSVFGSSRNTSLVLMQRSLSFNDVIVLSCRFSVRCCVHCE